MPSSLFVWVAHGFSSNDKKTVFKQACPYLLIEKKILYDIILTSEIMEELLCLQIQQL